MRIEHATHAFFFLPGIPWEDPDVTMSTKVGLFLHALDVLEVEVQEEAQLSLFYLVMAAMQLFRLLYATKAHPRIAILVKTLIVGLDDLAHFSILFLFLIGGYMALGHSQFGGSRPEFEVCLCVHSSSLLFAQNVPRLLLTTRALKQAHALHQHGTTFRSFLTWQRGLFVWSGAFDPFLSVFFFSVCFSQDFESSFRTLWEMMLGSMLGSGQIGSAAWTNDVPLLVYQLSYSILMFLILLNFIIAIIGQ
jgi:hypothetical protein